MAYYDIGEVFQLIEEEMIASMSRNLKRHISTEHAEGLNYSMWQAEQLAALNNYRKNNRKKFSKYFSTINSQIDDVLRKANATGKMDQEIRILEAIKKGFKVYDRSAEKTLRGNFFKINERKLNSLIEATKKDMARAETAMLRRADDEYRKILFNAEAYYNTGVGTLPQAVDMATKDFLSRGISCIEYANGAMVGIDVYSRMAIRTAQTRAYLQGESEKRDEWGINTVIVNKRGVACPRCLRYTGKVFYDDVWGHSPVPSSAKYPKLSTAISGGLYHPNCKDIHTTYFEGVSTPPEPMTQEEKDEANRVYALEQRQRYNERQIRKYKRLHAGSVDPENAQKYGEKLKYWQAEQKKHIEANSDVLRSRPELEKVFQMPDDFMGGNGGSSETVSSFEKVLTNLDVEDINNTSEEVVKQVDNIEGINSIATDNLYKSYDERRLHFNLNESSAEEIKADGYDIISANYDGVSIETAKAFNDTISDLSSEYYSGITRIEVADKKETFGATFLGRVQHNDSVGQKTLFLNPHKVGNHSKMVDTIRQLADRGYCADVAKGLEEKYVATHEFAHGLLSMSTPTKNWVGMDEKLVKAARKEIQSLYDSYMEELAELDKKVRSAAAHPALTDMTYSEEEQLNAILELGKAKKALRNATISEYSKDNVDEFLAESFAKVKLGTTSNRYADKVVEVLDKYYKK